ncbi:PglL family O-oligosaccharyltransferase [methane-oxidizing endosymbiont of Gigantopelta aegis]|uniref:PglL family O-oligosaccharyltransferase n=1 Tax=methane-oxidizing endosymbiont of Gigantopelta aegis TaxID=2794938 RepID=UPI0018DD676D|nr:Wzy polymerase domain-containing protein [methane-oxidizing endosymbiont of Gigantopelta aegis]
MTGQSGFSRTLDKTQKMTEGEFASARQTMYAIGLNLIKDKPLFGYGIGSFPRVWVEQKAKFLAQHPDAAVTSATTSHPHNEILFWFIEGGLVAVAGLMVILIVVCKALYQCGFSRGGAYMAMLFPITLHTQVELPFYISSVHWFLWLFLIYLVFRHQLKTVPLKISKMALTSLQAFILVLGLAGSAMLIHIEKAEREIFKYMYATDGNLQFALHDFYFNRFAEKLLMQSLLYQSIEHHDTSKIPLFINWAEKAIKQNPELGMFIMLSDAYGFIGNKDKQCQTAKKGAAIYPPNERLQKTAKLCF